MEQNLRHGIIEDRSCTDCLFFILFVASWVAFVILASYAYKQGDYTRISSPYDSFAHQCGKGLAKDYPLLYYTDPSDLATLTPETVCVRKCPKQDGQPISGENFLNQTAYPSRTTEVSKAYVTICLPDAADLLDNLFSKVGIEDTQKYFNDLEVSWAVLLSSLFIAFAMSFLMLNLLRYCIKVLIYLQIVSVFVLLVGGSVFGLNNYSKYDKDVAKHD